MNEIDILKSIADNLSERKSTAALNNYEVLCNNIKYVNVNGLLDRGVNSLKTIQSQSDIVLKSVTFVTNDFKGNTKPFFYFRTIILRLLLNDISIIEKFITYTQPDDKQGITGENVAKLE